MNLLARLNAEMAEQLLAEDDLALGGDSEGGRCSAGHTINLS